MYVYKNLVRVFNGDTAFVTLGVVGKLIREFFLEKEVFMCGLYSFGSP